MLAICDFELRFLRPKPLFFGGISGDLAPSTRKPLAIAIVRFWCAKVRAELHRGVLRFGIFLEIFRDSQRLLKNS